jgi:signal transduction histidine kinase/CheY-like chemotaxis protein/putative methionine-R-sulfoxide reductase with GAF domain/HPt (histidine-containing phosphotransfer) domain-containing protein
MGKERMTKPDQMLIVDDNLEMLKLLDNCLAPLGYDITLSANGRQGLELLETGQFSVAILDLLLPDLSGMEILRRIREQRPEIEIIMLTAHASLETAMEAVRLGTYDYVTKPFRPQTIRSAVKRAMEKQHLTTRLVAIQDLSREMALSLDVEQVAETVLDFAGRALKFQNCGLWLVDEEQDELYRLAARGTEQEAKPRLPLSGDKGITVAVARSGEPLYVPNVQEDPRYIALGAVGRSELAVPLRVKGRVIGVLDVESADIDAFGPDDARLLSTLAAQAGVAIENARLHEQAQQEIAERKQIEETLRYRVEFENLITSIATYFIHLPPDEIDDGINHALQAIGELAKVDRGFVFLLSHNGREIDNTHEWCAMGIEPQIDTVKRLSVKSLSWWTKRLNWFETVHIPRVTDLPPEAHGEKETWLQTAQSVIAIPMVYAKSLIGSLGFSSERAEKTWSEQDIRLLKTVGEIFVSALMRKQAEEALREAKDVAETANRAKSEFLARMSHEIRTPIHSIMGITELIMDTALTKEQRAYLGIVKSSADSLLAIINDILDFTRIEARHLELLETNFDLQATVEQAAQMMAQRTQEKGLDLACHISPHVPTALVGDPGRLRQVLVNLIGNAIKFTEQGEVVIQVEAEADHEEDLELHFTVRDTGIGISEDKQTVIFEAFRQADGSATREYGGTGLGLAICQQLVELMGGRIWVESALGEGSTFHFTVKYQKQAPARRDVASIADAADLKRPQVSGEEPLLSLRLYEMLRKDATQAGHLHRTTFGAVQVAPQSLSKDGAGRPTPVPEQMPSLRILLADDNAAGQLVGQKMLEKIGCVVQVASNGLETLQMLEEGEFDLILMDVEMPEMDGLQITRAIREREAGSGQHIPIIAVTAYAMKEDQERCLEAGMDGYLSKPVSSERLYDAIARFSSPNRDGDVALLAASPQGEETTTEIDLAAAMEVVGGDGELLREAVGLFLEQDYPRQLRDLREGLERQDAQTVKAAAHGLKGSLGSFGGRAARDLALRLETMGREGKLSGAQSVLEEFEAAVERFAAFFVRDRRTLEENHEFQSAHSHC